MICAAPAGMSALALLGVTFSDWAWSAHVLIGIGILLLCGLFSLHIRYPFKAIGFFMGAGTLWYIWHIPEIEPLAYAMSTLISFMGALVCHGLGQDD